MALPTLIAGVERLLRNKIRRDEARRMIELDKDEAYLGRSNHSEAYLFDKHMFQQLTKGHNG